jgi:hypothetical protein
MANEPNLPFFRIARHDYSAFLISLSFVASGDRGFCL